MSRQDCRNFFSNWMTHRPPRLFRSSSHMGLMPSCKGDNTGLLLSCCRRFSYLFSKVYFNLLSEVCFKLLYTDLFLDLFYSLCLRCCRRSVVSFLSQVHFLICCQFLCLKCCCQRSICLCDPTLNRL